MRSAKPRHNSFLHALDEATFGSERTLNLRELLPSAAEARLRAETWLRARQVTKVEEVLIITGRGNQSAGGIGVIRQEIAGMMPSLRRRGIVESWREHSPGSIIVKLAPTAALFSAAKRRRDSSVEKPSHKNSLTGLEPETLSLLKELAIQNLDSLGVEQTDPFLQTEILRIFSTLIEALPESANREEALRVSIRNALDETGQR